MKPVKFFIRMLTLCFLFGLFVSVAYGEENISTLEAFENITLRQPTVWIWNESQWELDNSNDSFFSNISFDGLCYPQIFRVNRVSYPICPSAENTTKIPDEDFALNNITKISANASITNWIDSENIWYGYMFPEDNGNLLYFWNNYSSSYNYSQWWSFGDGEYSPCRGTVMYHQYPSSGGNFTVDVFIYNLSAETLEASHHYTRQIHVARASMPDSELRSGGYQIGNEYCYGPYYTETTPLEKIYHKLKQLQWKYKL